jgi:hypothetical protein
MKFSKQQREALAEMGDVMRDSIAAAVKWDKLSQHGGLNERGDAQLDAEFAALRDRQAAAFAKYDQG